jgi:surface protein
MFAYSQFNGDISNWNVSNVKDMSYMFEDAKFSGILSKWNVSNVINMKGMFNNSAFVDDLIDWRPCNTENLGSIFYKCSAPVPYWANYENKENRNIAIEKYWVNKELKKELNNTNALEKKMKI